MKHKLQIYLLEAQSRGLGEAYIAHAEAIKKVIAIHNLYHADLYLKSNHYFYTCALAYLEGTKQIIYELKDDFLKTGSSDWLP